LPEQDILESGGRAAGHLRGMPCRLIPAGRMISADAE